MVSGCGTVIANESVGSTHSNLDGSIEHPNNMSDKSFPIIITYLLVCTLICSSLAFGQTAAKPIPADSSVSSSKTSYAGYLMEVSDSPSGSLSYAREVQAIARVLSSASGKNAVLIDNQGYVRETVAQGVAARLARSPNGKKLYRVNWNAVFGATRDENEFGAIVDGILKYVAASKGKFAIYLDDIAGFSHETPMLGDQVAAKLYKALSQGQVQIVSAAAADEYARQVAGDSRLSSRFEKVEILQDSTEDFVGDKLSPDLRDLVAGDDQNQTVKVILQSDDIDNPQLLNVLKRNGVAITGRADALNMLVIDLPIRVAEEIADVQSAKHLSLDQEINLLGHIETTTGVSLVRTLTNTSQLDGSGVGIAVVDSGVYENHHHFMDSVGADRVVANVDFTGTNGSSVSKDPYGHGSHVAGLMAGSKGSGTELLEYRGMAPNAKIIDRKSVV